MNQEISTIESVTKKLRQEQFNAMERGFKLEERKILFILALFGLGGYGSYGVNLDNLKIFGYLYFLTPMLAIAFDVLIERQTFCVCRIGVFLRGNSKDELEKKWERFVDENRDTYFRFGIEGFTFLTFLISMSIWVRLIYLEIEKKLCITYTTINFSNIKTYITSEYPVGWFFLQLGWFLLLIFTAFYTRIKSYKRRKQLFHVWSSTLILQAKSYKQRE